MVSMRGTCASRWRGRRGLVDGSWPCGPGHVRFEWDCPRGLEVAAGVISERDQGGLGDALVWDAEQLGCFLFVLQVERGPGADEAAMAGREHEAPRGGKDRAIEAGGLQVRNPWNVNPSVHAWDDHHPHLIRAVGQVLG